MTTLNFIHSPELKSVLSSLSSQKVVLEQDKPHKVYMTPKEETNQCWK